MRTLALVLAVIAPALVACSDIEERRTLDRDKASVAALLKDPSSAQWGKTWRRSGVSCGTVNGKNSFGAYEGARRFYVAGDSVQIEGSGDLHPAVFERLFSAGCRDGAGSPDVAQSTADLSTAIRETRKIGAPPPPAK